MTPDSLTTKSDLVGLQEWMAERLPQESGPPCPALLTFDQVAEMQGVTARTIAERVRRGEIETVHTKHGRRIRKEDV